MARKAKPHVHGRDHEHGGADTTLIHYEDVGTSGGGSGGIQFDSYPQDGQWLYLETDGPATSPSGFGVEIYDPSGNGVDLASSSGGQITLDTTGGGDILLQSTGDIVLIATGTANILMPALPTSDPGVFNALWVDSSGFLRRSF